MVIVVVVVVVVLVPVVRVLYSSYLYSCMYMLIFEIINRFNSLFLHK